MSRLKRKNFFFVFLYLCYFQLSFGQLLTNNNQVITITPGAQLTVKGDIQNNAGASETNNGTIDLTGNWTNNAGNTNFGTSTGTVILNGANQTIGGSSSTTFNNLTLLGSGTKTLGIITTVGGGNASPAGVLNVGTVTLDLNSKILTVVNSSTNAIQSTTGYILSDVTSNASVVKWTVNAILGTHTIPFGNAGGVLIPFTYNLTSGNAGDISVSTYPTNPANLPLPVTPTAVTHVRDNSGANNSANMPDRFWNVDKSGPTGVASLTFTYAPAENAANGNTNVRMQLWNQPQDSWEPALIGQVNPSSQSVLVPGAAYSGVWGSALSGTPLPIELLNFTAKLNSKKEVDIKWQTASEINNDYFTVEKSADGKNYELFEIIDGAGNSTTLLSYKTVDKNPFAGITYYRLKQTDFNGDFSYSQIETVKLYDANNLLIYPNPAAQTLIIESIGSNGGFLDKEILVYNSLGQKIRLPFTSNLNNTLLYYNVEQLAPGNYFISIRSANSSVVKKFVKL